MGKRGKQTAGLGGKKAALGSPVLGSREGTVQGDVTEQTRAAAVKPTAGGARAEAPPPRGSRPTPPAGVPRG